MPFATKLLRRLSVLALCAFALTACQEDEVPSQGTQNNNQPQEDASEDLPTAQDQGADTQEEDLASPDLPEEDGTTDPEDVGAEDLGPDEDMGPEDMGAGRYHPSGWANPTNHGLAAKLQEQDCRDCHGEDLRGDYALSCDTCHAPGWRTDCTHCHGGDLDATGAPPRGLDPSRPEVFPPHQAHVGGTLHAPFDCTTCHVKPVDVLSLNHMFDDTPAAVEVNFAGGLSPTGRYDDEGGCSNLYCHGTGLQPGSWSIAQGEVNCTSCHPNQSSGRDGWERMSEPHSDHLREGLGCQDCHGSVVGADGNLVDISLHVNGRPDVTLPDAITYEGGRCDGTCHGENHRNRRWEDD